MNSRILLAGLVLVAFVARLGECSPASILKGLANIQFPGVQVDLASRCEAYDKFLSLNHPDLARAQQNDRSGRIQGLLQALRTTGTKPEAGQEATLVGQLSECVELLDRAAAAATGAAGKHIAGPAPPATFLDERALPVTFSSAGLAKLSQARQNVKSLALDVRCEAYTEALRAILAGQQVATESKPVLFSSVLRVLAARQVPFQQGQAPFVETLGECVSKLSAYQDEPSRQRNVVAGPGYQREPLGPVEVDPVENMRHEFNQVKKNVVDHGQDLYARVPSETDSAIDYNVDVDVPPPSPGHAGFEIDSSERYRPRSNGLVNPYIVDETYDELARRERDPVRKLELQLESERRTNKRLLQQLDDNQYELGSLKQQVSQLEKVVSTGRASKGGSPLEESRLFEMKRLYEQASERELKTNEKYEHLLRKYEDLEARLLLERGLTGDRHADLDGDDDDDDDDDDDEDDDDHLKDWPRKKEKKAWKKQEKKAEKELKKKVEKEKEKEKERKVERTADGEKIYRDPVDLARKLQNKMSSSETPEGRCQKYYALLNHPGKVTKKVLKTIAKLNLPKGLSVGDPEFFQSLSYYADLLSRSDNKDAREASAEMQQCLKIGSVNVHHNHQQQQQQQVPLYGYGQEFDYDHGNGADYPSYAAHTNRYNGGLLGSNYYQQNKRSFRGDRSPSKKAPASGYEIPVEYVSADPANKRNPLSRGNSNKYAPAAYANAQVSLAGPGDGPTTGFARFGPTSKLSQFQADHY